MAVTVDTAAAAASGAGFSAFPNMTVASGATVLLAWIHTTAATSAFTAAWGAQSMTLLTSAVNGNTKVQLFGLLAPSSGFNGVNLTWTGSSNFVACCISFFGTATDTLANAFTNATTNTGSGTSATVTITGGVSGNISVAGVTGAGATITSITATSSTGVFADSTNFAAGGARAPSTASVAWTGTIASGAWAICAVDVAAPVVVAPTLAWHRPSVSFFR